MNSIFIIFSQIDDYESCPDSCGFVHTKEEAERAVLELITHYNEALEWQKKLITKGEEFYSKNPELSYKPLREIQKWPAGIGEKDITLEMKKKRENDKAYNQMIMDSNSLMFQNRKAQRIEFQRELFNSMPEYIKTMFNDDSFALNCHLDKTTPYFYEEIHKLKM